MASESKKKGGFWRGLGWLLAIGMAFELGLRLFGYGNYTIYRPDEKPAVGAGCRDAH